MLKKAAGAGVFALAILLAASRNEDNNMVTNPPAATSTPIPGAPTPTRTPVPTNQIAMVQVGAGGGNVFLDQQSGTSETRIHVGDTVQWTWESGFHSTTSGTCAGGCTPDGMWDSGVGSGMTFSHTFTQAGTFPYFCLSHGAMMQGTVIVQ